MVGVFPPPAAKPSGCETSALREAIDSLTEFALRNRIFACVALALWALAAQGCTKDPASPSGGGNAPQLTAPAVDAPSDDEQLSTLRPTLVVRNGTSSVTGSRTYEFQVSTSSAFATIHLSRGAIVESASGKTSFAVDSDLQSTTRYYW